MSVNTAFERAQKYIFNNPRNAKVAKSVLALVSIVLFIEATVTSSTVNNDEYMQISAGCRALPWIWLMQSVASVASALTTDKAMEVLSLPLITLGEFMYTAVTVGCMLACLSIYLMEAHKSFAYSLLCQPNDNNNVTNSGCSSVLTNMRNDVVEPMKTRSQIFLIVVILSVQVSSSLFIEMLVLTIKQSSLFSNKDSFSESG